jgi:hypothetical protein
MMINRDVLTYVGCSSSVALLLLAVDPAQADVVREIEFVAPHAWITLNAEERFNVRDPLASDRSDCTCSQTNSPEAIDADAEGALAINVLGCDCAGCRNMVRQMLQANTLSFPR